LGSNPLPVEEQYKVAALALGMVEPAQADGVFVKPRAGACGAELTYSLKEFHLT
jgi:hypothetical protein